LRTMSLFDEDPAADFLTREQESLGDVLGAGSFEVIPDNPSLDFLDEAPVEAVLEQESQIMSEPEIIAPSAELFADDNVNTYAALKEATEPDSIRVWRQEQQEQISARDTEAETKRQEWKTEAAKELANWHSKQEEVLTKNKAANREAQELFLKDNEEAKPGQQWEKICKLCDFNPKSNRNSRDTARMRSILLQLKQSPLIR